MDKLLLTAFLSALAGFLTAILSIVKLVNEKESKTSEYRQAWTDSARKCLADLVGLINTLASLNWGINKDAVSMNEIMKTPVDPENKDNADLFKSFMQEKIQVQHTKRREATRELHQTYAMTRLHFRLNDHDFGRIEQSVPHILTMLENLAVEEDVEKRTKLKEKIHSAADELTTFSRILLKTEWEIVKRGEKAFQKTKRWTIYGSIVMLFILISIGIHAVISMWKENIKASSELSVHYSLGVSGPEKQSPEQLQTLAPLAVRDAPPQTIQITNSASCEAPAQQQVRQPLSQSPKLPAPILPDCARK